MAMLVQYLSAKAGVATGRDLPELCRDAPAAARSPCGLWVQAELIAMATDLAEFVGAAVGLNLLFHVPLLAGRADHGGGRVRHPGPGAARLPPVRAGDHRRCSAIVFCGFAYDLVAVGADPGGIAAGLIPSLPGGDSLLLVARHHRGDGHAARGLPALGADQVPRACRDDAERRELLRFQRLDVVIALGAAGLVNLAMLFVAACAVPPHRRGTSAGLDHRGRPRRARAGWSAAAPRWRSRSRCSPPACPPPASAPTPARSSCRASSAAASRCSPAARSPCSRRSWCSALGLPATGSLVISQVVLSFGIPFALVPLLLLTRRRDIMGALVNRRLTTATTGVIAAVIIALNIYLLTLTILA